jgi:hypothetical protein
MSLYFPALLTLRVKKKNGKNDGNKEEEGISVTTGVTEGRVRFSIQRISHSSDIAKKFLV